MCGLLVASAFLLPHVLAALLGTPWPGEDLGGARAGGLSPSRYEFAIGGGRTRLFKAGVR